MELGILTAEIDVWDDTDYCTHPFHPKDLVDWIRAKEGMKQNIPARIHAVLAKDEPYGVVFRRGPSKQVCTLLWDRHNDTFKIGQWLKGRIYERRCDISPNGKYLIYFAMNGKWDSETGGSWTAISKAPWLKALELHSKGDCWEGGGLFLSNNRYWLNDSYFNAKRTIHLCNEVSRDASYAPKQEFGAEDTGVYYRRLIRDGWQLTSKKVNAKWNSETIFEKELPKGWVLIKIAHEQVGSLPGKGCYWDEHMLINHKTDTRFELPDWEWAELDRGSLVWASMGIMHRAAINNSHEIGKPVSLFDFNQLKFEHIKAPY